MTETKKILCFFSSNNDSSLAAILAAKGYSEVYLVTYIRYGLLSPLRPKENLTKLKKIFPHTKFHHLIESIENEYKNIRRDHFFRNLIKYGLLTADSCGLCRLAMHWKAIQICKRYSINIVYDGSSNPAHSSMPTENENIALKSIRKIYEENAIKYINPLIELEIGREYLAKRKESNSPTANLYPVCGQYFLFRHYTNLHSNQYSLAEFEKRLKPYFDSKITYVKKKIQEN